MAPFVPTLISEQISLVLALFIGFAFGWVLEQAGFSSSRRLVGLFYGNDFTVLRVFFTAAVTAMLGVILLGKAGFLDVSAIYINPTFVGPILVGGVVMGIGFILGGYCPGTSMAALSIGKVDALFFVLGGLVGAFVFGEAYNSFHAFYESGSLGPVKVYESLHISQEAFAAFLTVAAVGAFAAAGWVERKVAKEEAPSSGFKGNTHVFAGVAAVLAALIILAAPSRKASLLAKVSDPNFVENHKVLALEPDEVAFRLADNDPKFRVLDTRSASDRKGLPLPGSIELSPDDLFTRNLEDELYQPLLHKVVVASDPDSARKTALIMTELGFVNVAVIDGGIQSLKDTVLQPATTAKATPLELEFREEARARIKERLAAEKAKASPAKKPDKVVKGGC